MHRPKAEFDFMLPLKARFNVLVGHKGIDASESRASLSFEASTLYFDTWLMNNRNRLSRQRRRTSMSDGAIRCPCGIAPSVTGKMVTSLR